MNVKRLLPGLTILSLFLFAACSNNAPQPTPASPPPTTAQLDTATLPALAPTNVEPTIEPTKIPPTQVSATATAQPTDVPAESTAVPTQAASNMAGVPIGSIDEVLKKACAALKAQPNVNAHLVLTGKNTGEFLVQVVGTEKAHLLMASGENSQEEIVLPPNFYVKEDGAWALQPVPKESVAKFTQAQITSARNFAGLFICFDNKAQSRLRAQITDVRAKLALPEIVDGVATLVYDVNVTVVNGNETGTGEVKYWLGATDSLPHKLWLQYTSAKQQGLVEGTYSYNAADIEPPIP